MARGTIRGRPSVVAQSIEENQSEGKRLSTDLGTFSWSKVLVMRRAILVLLCCFTANAFAQTRIALTGATLIDGRGGAPVKNANVIIADGKIECAGADCAVPKGAKVVDAKGMWMTPGLVDSHVHFSQTGWADGRPDALDVRAQYPYENTLGELKTHPERFAHTYLCSGVTGVFDVGGYPWTLQLASRFEKDTTAPHISAAGPLLSTLDHWLNLPAERQFIHLKDEESGRGGVKYLAAQGAKAIKVWYIVSNALPVEQSEPFVTAAGDEAKKHGLPLIVHATGLAEAKAALRAGATLLVHSVWDLHVDDEFIALAKKNGTILTPTLTVAGGYGRMFASVVGEIAIDVDDPNRCVDTQTVAKVKARAAHARALADRGGEPDETRGSRHSHRNRHRRRQPAHAARRVDVRGDGSDAEGRHDADAGDRVVDRRRRARRAVRRRHRHDRERQRRRSPAARRRSDARREELPARPLRDACRRAAQRPGAQRDSQVKRLNERDVPRAPLGAALLDHSNRHR
jgi:imidazolonepropionase-like amidohydrolase